MGVEMTSHPSREAWRSLYEEALKFKDLAPWAWMWDSDVFGIEDPVTREIGYCCVMGRNKQHYGLTVYLGVEGLEHFLQVQSGLMRRDPGEVFLSMKCLTASFEDRRFISPKDHTVVKEMGLKFRGKQGWAKFRSYLPGYEPWYLNGEEVAYLTLCLKHAKEIATRFKDDPKLLHPLKDDRYFVRLFPDKNTSGSWIDERHKPVFLTRVVKISKQIPVDQLERIKRLPRGEGHIWEIDLFPAPARVGKAGERGFIPVCILFIDQASHFIINFHMESRREYRTEFIEAFLVSLEKAGLLPSEIQLKNEELLNFLEPLAAEFSIILNHVMRCPAVEDARVSMRDFFGRR
jgi:hypothetical protein